MRLPAHLFGAPAWRRGPFLVTAAISPSVGRPTDHDSAARLINRRSSSIVSPSKNGARRSPAMLRSPPLRANSQCSELVEIRSRQSSGTTGRWPPWSEAGPVTSPKPEALFLFLSCCRSILVKPAIVLQVGMSLGPLTPLRVPSHEVAFSASPPILGQVRHFCEADFRRQTSRTKKSLPSPSTSPDRPDLQNRPARNSIDYKCPARDRPTTGTKPWSNSGGEGGRERPRSWQARLLFYLSQVNA